MLDVVEVLFELDIVAFEFNLVSTSLKYFTLGLNE